MTISRKALWGAALALLGGLAGCAPPARIMTDLEIDRLCAKDGGIKVYERVELPAKYFYPDIKWNPRSGQVDLDALKNDLGWRGPNYTMPYSSTTVSSPTATIGITRWHQEVVEQPSGRKVAEVVDYVRSGGDFANPFPPTVHSCLDTPPGPAVLRQTFFPVNP